MNIREIRSLSDAELDGLELIVDLPAGTTPRADEIATLRGQAPRPRHRARRRSRRAARRHLPSQQAPRLHGRRFHVREGRAHRRARGARRQEAGSRRHHRPRHARRNRLQAGTRRTRPALEGLAARTRQEPLAQRRAHARRRSLRPRAAEPRLQGGPRERRLHVLRRRAQGTLRPRLRLLERARGRKRASSPVACGERSSTASARRKS